MIEPENDRDAIERRKQAWREWLRTHPPKAPRAPIRPFIERAPTAEELERIREVMRNLKNL